MGKDSGTVAITPRALTTEELLVIGRIVRACADLEDCLNLWICKLARTDEACSAVILGRSNISTKISIALGLAKLSGDKMLKLHQTAFDSAITQLLDCRNSVAHGALAGESDDDHVVFVTNHNTDYKEANLERRADAYTIGTLSIIAAGAELRVSRLDRQLGLGALREKRLWQLAPVRPTHQQKGKRGAERKRQPRPSPA
jgi:hypothetical protein